jgi:hypothetical protein
VSVTEDDGTLLRIGDPTTTVTGRHDYTRNTSWRARSTRSPTTVSCSGTPRAPDWEVPIDDLTVTVTAPGGITRSRCLAGPPGSTASCGSPEVEGDQVTFTYDRLEPGEVLSIVAAFSLDDIEIPPPILEPHNPVLRAFQITPVTVGSSVLLLGLGALPLVLALRRRRDRRCAGAIPGLPPAPGDVAVVLVAASTGVRRVTGTGVRPVNRRAGRGCPPAPSSVPSDRRPGGVRRRRADRTPP